MSWGDETSPKKMAAASVFAVGFVIALGWGLFHEAPKIKQQSYAGITTTTADEGSSSAATGSTPTPRAGHGSGTTTTLVAEPAPTLPSGAPADESAVASVQQLQYDYTQAKSGLDPTTYSNAVAIGKAFVTADATGAGAANFAAYFDADYPDRPWMSGFQLQYATAITTPVDSVVIARVWYKGTPTTTNAPVSQVRQDVYLDVQNNLAPMHEDQIAARGVPFNQSNCCTTIIN